MVTQLREDIRKMSDPKRAVATARFFKTGAGQYGEGDIFCGITVPQSRIIAAKYKDLSLSNIKILIESHVHEERLIALLILVHQFNKSNQEKRKEIYEFYLLHTKYINNWDLVDLSADKIVGSYLINKDISVLLKLAKSDDIWERRISIISTFCFIKEVQHYEETFTIADILLLDKHDLIHKAVGWMLREVGKRVSQEKEEEFLKLRYKKMPRTMLRYAIERFSEEKRKMYLNAEI